MLVVCTVAVKAIWLAYNLRLLRKRVGITSMLFAEQACDVAATYGTKDEVDVERQSFSESAQR